MFAGLQGGGGSGFGLYICKGIVDLHEGVISVFSEGEGLGSTFTVQLPMQQPSKAARTPLMSRRLQPIVDDLDRRKRSVMHVHSLSQQGQKSRVNSLSQQGKKSRVNSLSQQGQKSIHEVQTPTALQTNNTTTNDIYNSITEWRLAAEQSPTPPQQQQQATYRVLMVDDSTMNRKMLGKLLRSVGHECDEANDGDVAVAKVTPDCHPLNCTTSPVIAF